MSDRSEPSPGDRENGSLSEKARQFADDIKARASTHAEDGKARGAERLEGVAETVDRVADEVAGQSPAMADWVRKAAGELDNVSRNLKEKSVGDLLAMGKDFARREPAAFIAASALAGFALSRLLKSSAPGSSAQGSSASASSPLVTGSGGTSGMAYHPGDAVRPTAKPLVATDSSARPDPAQPVRQADAAPSGAAPNPSTTVMGPTATNIGGSK